MRDTYHQNPADFENPALSAHIRPHLVPVEEGKQRYKQTLSRSISARLTNSARAVEVQAMALRIDACNSDQNLFVASDLHNDAGELYDGKGSLWHCRSKLCQNCLSYDQRRSRKILRDVLDSELSRLPVRYSVYFIVLTQPDFALLGLPLAKQRQVMYDAHERFYSSKFWKDVSRGSAKTEEFTLGNQNVKGHYHYHINLLATCRNRITRDDYSEIRSEWTKALQKAFRKHGVEWDCPTRDGLVNVYVQKVSGRNKEKIVLELSKYVTKSQNWNEIPIEDLEEILLIPRFWRMFETYGSYKKAAQNRKEKAKTAQSETFHDAQDRPDVSNIYTKQITPIFRLPKRRKSWRVRCREIPLWQYKLELANEIEECQFFRRQFLAYKFPFAMFQTLQGDRFSSAPAAFASKSQTIH